jgi:outer membrane protein OmpA-like peptidoglycan-associated protein
MFRRSPLLVAAALLLAVGPATAQEASIDIQQFKPVSDIDGFLLVHDASLLPQLRFGVGLNLNYAVNPLEVNGPGFGRQFGLVDGLIGGDLTAALSIFDFWDVGLRFPVAQVPVATDFVGSPAFPGSKVPFGIGDVLIESRIRVFDPAASAVGFAVNPWVTLPTGTARAGLGRGLPGTGVKLITSKRWARFHFAANAGFAFFGRASSFLGGGGATNLTTGNEFTYGLGVGVSPVVDHLEINLELDGSLIAGPNERDDTERFFNQAHSPAEVLLSVRGTLDMGLTFHAGVGKGISGGYGTPDVRVFAGVGWANRNPRDRDGDGLNDKVDPCPLDPEDVDQFEDEDGCPDPDNDADGIADELDGCPLDPEDKDGFEDADGCPDLDNDADGVPDTQDGCPNDPEDRDGFADDDGCVDPDNDADTVLDTVDTCPMAPEDIDGFQDADGCPDPDNDEDGIPDTSDLCPDVPEDLNGVKDTDGCPDDTLAVKSGDSIVILEKVFFATGKDKVLRRSQPVLRAVAKVLSDNPEVTRVRVEGHTDDVGADAGNLDLSQRRAESVMRELVKLDIDAGCLEAVGYGETRPIDTNRTENGRERNRRVEFTILEGGAGARAPAPIGPATPTPAAEPIDASKPWGLPTPNKPTPVAAPPVPDEPASIDSSGVQPETIWGADPADEPAKSEDDGEETPKEEEPRIEQPSGPIWWK